MEKSVKKDNLCIKVQKQYMPLKKGTICNTCTQKVTENSCGCQCNICQFYYYHSKCINISKQQFDIAKSNTVFLWNCDKCGNEFQHTSPSTSLDRCPCQQLIIQLLETIQDLTKTVAELKSQITEHQNKELFINWMNLLLN